MGSRDFVLKPRQLVFMIKERNGSAHFYEILAHIKGAMKTKYFVLITLMATYCKFLTRKLGKTDKTVFTCSPPATVLLSLYDVTGS